MKADNITILITGSTGNIGSEILKQLSNSTSDLKLRGAVHSGDASINNSKDKRRVQQVVMDFDRPQTIVEGLKNVDELFVLTPTHPKMVEFTSNLVNGAKKAEGKGVKHIVKLSHIRADVQPEITITNLHRQAEKVIEESGIPYTFLRPNFFMQNFINYYSIMIKKQNTFSLSAGDGKVSFTDIRDIGSVAASVLTEDNEEHMGKSYDITGPESLTYSETADILSPEVGKKIRYIDISEDHVRQLTKDMGMSDWHTNVLVELLRITRDGFLYEVSSAVEKVTERKSISFSRFAKDYAAVFR
ncbi:MAG: SDR family oxidoreductase [Nitrososphaeraceae archaeon]